MGIRPALIYKPCKPSSASPRNQLLNITPRGRLILAPRLPLLPAMMVMMMMMVMLPYARKKARRAVHQPMHLCPGSVEFRSTLCACSPGRRAWMPWGGLWGCYRERTLKPLSSVAASRCGFPTPQSPRSKCVGVYAYTKNIIWKRRILHVSRSITMAVLFYS